MCTHSTSLRIGFSMQHKDHGLQSERNGRRLVISRLGTSLLRLLSTNFHHQRQVWVKCRLSRIPCGYFALQKPDHQRPRPDGVCLGGV